MKKDIIDSGSLGGNCLYHGRRADLKPGDFIKPAIDKPDVMSNYVYFTHSSDSAIWEAEIGTGEGPGRVYIIEPTGQIEKVYGLTDRKPPGHPSMSYCSRNPLRVTGEVTEWPLYHGTRANLKPGDLIESGRIPNFGNKSRKTTYVYLTRTFDAAI